MTPTSPITARISEYGHSNDREPHEGLLPTFRVIVTRKGAIDTDTESSYLITIIPWGDFIEGKNGIVPLAYFAVPNAPACADCVCSLRTAGTVGHNFAMVIAYLVPVHAQCRPNMKRQRHHRDISDDIYLVHISLVVN